MSVLSLGGGEEEEGGREDEDGGEEEEEEVDEAKMGRTRGICMPEKQFEGGCDLVGRDGAGSRKAADGASEARERRRKRKGRRRATGTIAPAIPGTRFPVFQRSGTSGW